MGLRSWLTPNTQDPTPKTLPSILQLSISPGGLPKRAVAESLITPLGLAGDGHAHPRIHGGPEKALLLIDAAVVDELSSRGYPVYRGALGENLTVEGLDRRHWRAGQRYRAGHAIIELTTIRVPCHQLDPYGPAIKEEIYEARVKAGDPASPRWAMSGFYARVLTPGPVRVNDPIVLLSTLA